MADLADRLPPQNIEAERGAIGSMLFDNDTIDVVMRKIRPDDCYRDPHEILCATIFDLHTAGSPVDALILSDELARRDLLKRVGGDDYIADVLASVPHPANAAYYAGIVKEKAVLRGCVLAANNILTEAYSGLLTAGDVLRSLEWRVRVLSEGASPGAVTGPSELAAAYLSRIAARSSRLPLGLITGWPALDEFTDGFQRGQLVVLAGRPSMGKTALALAASYAVAVRTPDGSPPKPVLYCSLEMGEGEIAERAVTTLAGIDSYRARKSWLWTADEGVRVSAAVRELDGSLFHVDAASVQSSMGVRAAAGRLRRDSGLAMVVVDYAQLVAPEDGRDPRQEQVSKVSRSMKSLARDLDVPVLLLSQLNREVERREDHRPRMADLRESGALEQDADVVLLAHRPEYYDPNDRPGDVELIVAKNRNGATGTVNLGWLKHCGLFFDKKAGPPPAAGPGPAAAPDPAGLRVVGADGEPERPF